LIYLLLSAKKTSRNHFYQLRPRPRSTPRQWSWAYCRGQVKAIKIIHYKQLNIFALAVRISLHKIFNGSMTLTMGAILL